MKIKVILILAFLSFSLPTFSQTYKIGYVNIELIYDQWPERKKASINVTEFGETLKKSIKIMQDDYKTQLAAYERYSTTTDAVKKTKKAELDKLRTKILQKEQSFYELIKKKETELFTSLQIKLRNAINTVGKENNYTHIISKNTTLLFTSDTNGDISSKIALKLGFTLDNK